jgi:protein gp37
VSAATRFLSLEPLLGPLPSLDLTGIDWGIVGGESGPGYRTLDLTWVRDLRDRATRQDIAFFFKLLCTSAGWTSPSWLSEKDSSFSV